MLRVEAKVTQLSRGSTAAELDIRAALKVIANPGQRRALELVTASEIGSSELAEACGWTRAATSQNLRVLREAALVHVRVDGNRRLYRANQENLRRLRAYLDEFWSDRLGVLAEEVSRP